MFYFCDEHIPIPEADDDLEQLRQVIKFRKELDSQGLTSSYPAHAQFAENVRGGLLRAIRDILHESSLRGSTCRPNWPRSAAPGAFAPPPEPPAPAPSTRPAATLR